MAVAVAFDVLPELAHELRSLGAWQRDRGALKALSRPRALAGASRPILVGLGALGAPS